MYEGDIGITASIILPLFLLDVYVFFAVIFEELSLREIKKIYETRKIYIVGGNMQ